MALPPVPLPRPILTPSSPSVARTSTAKAERTGVRAAALRPPCEDRFGGRGALAFESAPGHSGHVLSLCQSLCAAYAASCGIESAGRGRVRSTRGNVDGRAGPALDRPQVNGHLWRNCSRPRFRPKGLKPRHASRRPHVGGDGGGPLHVWIWLRSRQCQEPRAVGCHGRRITLRPGQGGDWR